jgi:hypothetical protein
MTPPKPLPAFKEEILESKTILDLLSRRYGAEKDDTIDRFQSGDDTDLWDLIEEEKRDSLEEFEHSLTAAAPDDDAFEIEIISAGPIFWIRANVCSARIARKGI